MEQTNSNSKTKDLVANRYEIVKHIARGSMGSVYLAIDHKLAKIKVALKILHQKFSSDDLVHKRFANEVVIARKLTHKNIVRIYDFDEGKNGERMMSMEYVEGSTLDNILSELHGVVDSEDSVTCKLYESDLKRLLKIYRKALEGVAYAHDNGIMHRDLKPSNILVDQSDEPKIADFGLAYVAEASSGLTNDHNVLLGTPDYMAPEHVSGQRMTARSDVYSLGIIAFEILVGTTPFHADTPLAVAYKQVSSPLPSLSKMPDFVPKQFITLIKRATLKDPKERFSSVQEMIDFLDSKAIPGDITTSLYKTATIKKNLNNSKKEFGKVNKSLNLRFPLAFFLLKVTIALTFGLGCFLGTTLFLEKYYYNQQAKPGEATLVEDSSVAEKLKTEKNTKVIKKISSKLKKIGKSKNEG